ncbi:MAG: hypothetical protein OEX19_01360 [Gammaproteobacteria bacterium]|nr:hypothetical protein [Gammaproteobacteria bacterium]
MKKSALLLLLILGINSSAHAANALISLSDHSALMRFNLWVGGQSFGRSEAGMGLLFNDSDSYMVEGAFHVIDEVGTKVPGLVFGLGAKAYGGTNPDADVLALGVGGSFNYSIPGANRVFIGVDAYGAPPIVTGLDADWFWEWAAIIGYKVLQDQADVYIGYREYGAKLKEGQGGGVERFDSTPRLGIRIMF